jgi:hypothetical protein
MKPFVGWTKVAVMGVLFLQLCVAAFAQEEKKEQGLGVSGWRGMRFIRPTHGVACGR